MKKLFLLIALVAGFAASAKADIVSGYIKKDGTIVAPYQRSHPDQFRENNRNFRGY